MRQNLSPNRISRRDFIYATSTAIVGFIGLTTFLPAIGYVLSPAFQKSEATDWLDLGPMSRYPVGNTPSFVSFTRTKINGWERLGVNYGVFVVRQDEKRVRVLSNICTHLGCRVTWHSDIEHYVSPCHDGHFSLLGNVIGGPPPRPLDEFTAKIENGNLFIQLPPYKREA